MLVALTVFAHRIPYASQVRQIGKNMPRR